MQLRGFHIVSVYRATLLLILFLAIVVRTYRPEGAATPSEQWSLDLAPSGHAKVASRQAGVTHHKHKEQVQPPPGMASVLMQIAEEAESVQHVEKMAPPAGEASVLMQLAEESEPVKHVEKMAPPAGEASVLMQLAEESEPVQHVEKMAARPKHTAEIDIHGELGSCSYLAGLVKHASHASSSLVQVFSREEPPKKSTTAEDQTSAVASSSNEKKKGKGKNFKSAKMSSAPTGTSTEEQVTPENLDQTIKKQAKGGTVTEEQCMSVSHVIRNMYYNEKRVELACMTGGFVCLLVALVCVCLYIGMGLKPAPPTYWKNGRFFWWSFSNTFEDEIDVSDELLPVIQQLVDMTTTPDKMGIGRDGAWQTHKRFKVTRVVRVENGNHWNHYASGRAFTKTFKESLAEMPPVFRKETKDGWADVDSTFKERQADPLVGPFLKSLGLDNSRNEVMLFHGSPLAGARNRNGDVIFPTEAQAPMNAIKKTGFDERLGNAKGMLGSGTYFSDHVSKADCYAGRYHEWEDGKDPGSVGEEAAMFLARVCLGTPYVSQQSLEQLRRPPCVRGHFDANLAAADVQFGPSWREKGLQLEICEHSRCDSVISDMVIDGDPKNFREYVLYEKNCYPEFLFYYRRVDESGGAPNFRNTTCSTNTAFGEA